MNGERIKKELTEWLRCIIGAVLFALLINNTVIINAEIVSPSMEGTIMTDSRIFGVRPAYLFSEPERFDIIIFKYPDDESSDPYVKRIIGMPNEKVEIKDGKVYINDANEPLDDNFINETAFGSYGPFFVPEGCYFVLGDNRNNSWDSKDWNNNFVAKQKIIGKAVVGWFPSIKILH